MSASREFLRLSRRVTVLVGESAATCKLMSDTLVKEYYILLTVCQQAHQSQRTVSCD